MTFGQLVKEAVARHGRSRPRPPPASSTSPYFASCPRWKVQRCGVSSSARAACVAVSGPCRRKSPTSSSRVGMREGAQRTSVAQFDAARPAGLGGLIRLHVSQDTL